MTDEFLTSVPDADADQTATLFADLQDRLAKAMQTLDATRKEVGQLAATCTSWCADHKERIQCALLVVEPFVHGQLLRTELVVMQPAVPYDEPLDDQLTDFGFQQEGIDSTLLLPRLDDYDPQFTGGCGAIRIQVWPEQA